MRTAELAPGSILQQMYLDERLVGRAQTPGTFVDLGAGTGGISSVLLARQWRGSGVDLNEGACATNASTNGHFVSIGSYGVRHGDFLAMDDLGCVDLAISSMVLEHLDVDATDRFFRLVRSMLAPSGSLILMVPGSPGAWGIEDEVAGHVQRFDRDSVVEVLRRNGFHADHVVGLTYPLSNLLLPISNLVVSRAERQRLDLKASERTVLAGDRRVLFKTTYPAPLHWVLNRYTMYPFHLLQKRFLQHPESLVLYVEAKLAKPWAAHADDVQSS